MTREEMKELALLHLSNDNKKKVIKTLKYIQKLSKKEGDYVVTRDIIVLCYYILSAFEIDEINTTENGRKELEKLTKGLFTEKEQEEWEA